MTKPKKVETSGKKFMKRKNYFEIITQLKHTKNKTQYFERKANQITNIQNSLLFQNILSL